MNAKRRTRRRSPSPASVSAVKARRPASTSHMGANLAACALFFPIVFWLQRDGRIIETGECLLALAAAMLPMIAVDLHARWREGGLAPRHSFHLRRCAIKLCGLYATFLLIFGLYWLFPEYDKPLYRRAMELLHAGLAAFSLLAIPYVCWLDRRSNRPEDGLYHAGLWLLGRWAQADKRMLGEHLKAWAVKAFFLPLMIAFLLTNVEGLARFDWHFPDFMSVYRFAYHAMFSLDLLFACSGYIMTLRLLRTQIVSAEPTVLGWLVCLVCYAPFWAGLFYDSYFHYDNELYWYHWTATSPLWQALWGSTILLCLGVYAWASVAFGYRFSNLTYRGLITNGPYRFTKHPAYVFKCLSWWLISIPFIAVGSSEEALRHCLLLAGVCGIYFLRARTEENHLSNYPEYVAYGEWMNEHGLFSRLGRAIPYLAYSQARALRSGSRVYAPYAEREVIGQAES